MNSRFSPAKFALGIETDITPTEFLQARYPEITELSDCDIYPGDEWVCAGMTYARNELDIYRRGTKTEVRDELDDIID